MFKDLESQVAALVAKQMPALEKPSTPDPATPRKLTECMPDNPWLHCGTIAMNEGYLFMGDRLGSRPLNKLEFFPDRAAYLYCFVRLTDAAALRTDVVPKEVVLFDFREAHSFLTSMINMEQ